jgi:cupin fold WbuC family metalloprotein
MSIKNFSTEFLSNLSSSAISSLRGRQNFNLHHDYSEPCQQLFNAISLNSYITPHRHFLDPKDETLLAVRGLFAAIIFKECGELHSVLKFGSEQYLTQDIASIGVQLPPKVWHTVVALVEGSVLFEVKAGPFMESAAKEMAPWAPVEGSPESQGYFNRLKQLVGGG